MSEDTEVVESTESVETTETTEPVVETKVVAPKGLPADQEWGHVDFSDPVATQRRFNRMYAQTKHNEGIQKQLLEDNKKLIERLEAIENSKSKETLQSSLEKLKAERRNALINGDLVRADELDDAIFDLKTSTKNEPVKEKKEETPYISPGLQARVGSWITETDEEGNVLRPYATPGHPQHEQFRKIVEGILADPEVAATVLHLDANDPNVDEVFTRVDKAMEAVGLSKKRKTRINPPVLAPTPKGGNAAGETKLTMEQIAVAKKLYKGDPDPIGRYKKALGKV